MSSLVIFALRVNGGILALCPLPGGGGDYAEDLEHLHDWAPAMVITLVTEAEMMQHGAATLGADVQAMGARWVHMPIVDFGAPEPASERIWTAASTQARAALKGGGRVLVHCKGGCGRSGMAVLRLMIESGEEPLAALERLRALRPCAVETLAQLRWAKAGLPEADDDTGAGS